MRTKETCEKRDSFLPAAQRSAPLFPPQNAPNPDPQGFEFINVLT